MRKLTQTMTKVWLLALTASLLAGIGQINAQDETPQPTPEETSAAANPAAEEVSENKADYDALIEAQGNEAYAFDFFTTSMLWTVIAAAMVFIMHLGFATLEAGLTQKKNTVNILFKNVWIISIANEVIEGAIKRDGIS